MSNFRSFIGAGALAMLFISYAAAQDPPARVARLNLADGNVSMQPAGLSDWTPAEVNRPFTTGDSLYTDSGSRAEFHLDSAVIRASEYTNFAFLTLDDQTIQISLTQGDLYINLNELEGAQTVEVDSPNASVSLLRQGLYRFRVASNGDLTFVVVRQGTAEISAGGQALSVAPGSSAELSGTATNPSGTASTVAQAPPPDDFDLWAQERDAAEAQSPALQYLPRSVVGYEDLGSNGDWRPAPEYGSVWYPRNVASGWAPYHDGHWAWIEPWGWTWVDDAPWGFAPFHYGRWVFVSGRWGWSPGPIVVVAHRSPVVRPVYAPALVAWFGGPGFGADVRVGGGAPSLGWVPLGFGEVYTPSYHCSPRYFSNVNVSNTTVVRTVNITNVYNTVYVNKAVYNQKFVNMRAPNAVTTMPQNAFAGGRPVSQAGMAMPPHEAQHFKAQNAIVTAPLVVPSRQALLASRAVAGPVAHPAAQVISRQVVVQHAPAVVPVPFAARQVYLQQHAGEAHDFAAMHAQVAPRSPAPSYVPAKAQYPAASGPRPMTAPNAVRQPQPAPYVANPVEPRRPQPAPVATPTPAVAPRNAPAPPRQPTINTQPVAPAPRAAYPEREHEHVARPTPPKPPANPPAPAPADKHTDDSKKKKEHA